MEENNNVEVIDNEKEEEIKKLKKQWFYKYFLVFIICGCIVGIAATALTYYLTLKKFNDKFIASTYKIDKITTNAKDEVGEISEILNSFAEIVDSQYIGEIEKGSLINETIKGFVRGIGDEYSEYMTAEEWKQYKEEVLGDFCGVGIVMTQADNGYILVNSLIKGGPAKEAGILQGDYIIGVNGESVLGISTTDVASKVKGEAGTEVTLNILRGEDQNLAFTLKRQVIRAYHVEGQMLEDGIGYISFTTFDSGCSAEFEEETDKLVEQGAKQLILDLRYNTGGEVDQALKILDLFLEKGQIELITQSATGPKLTTSSETDKKYNFDNIIILTNNYTASAAEILTGALVDNNLAKTLGDKTYGKGVMQSIFSLLDGSVLKLTTQEYNTPKGTQIQGVGITPDYEVENIDPETDTQLEKAKELMKIMGN